MDHPPRGRPSLRLPPYDYAQPGGYFVTICTQDRLCLFGHIDSGGMYLNAAGEMITEVWESLASRFPHIILDAFIVMPNHVHGIVLIQERQEGKGLGQIIGAFKSLVTNRYMVGVRQQGWPAFPGKLWQDNYFEHIIRNDAALDQIRLYFAGNGRTIRRGRSRRRQPGKCWWRRRRWWSLYRIHEGCGYGRVRSQ